MSENQVQVALDEQAYSERRIGEILVDHGWLKQESADFFAEVWPCLQEQTLQEPLGQYLKQAALLEDAHIKMILQEQRQTKLKFGTLAILKGWVQRQTINFFLEHLDSYQINSPRQRVNARDFNPDSEVIRKQLVENKSVNPFLLLMAYRGILEWGAVEEDGSPEQAELLKIGLVTREDCTLRIARGLNPVLLDPQWVAQVLDQLRPYNQIRLKLFKFSKNSEHPYQVLTAIQAWTGNQPDLTQAICQVIKKTGKFISAGEETAQIEKLVQNHIIQDWKSGAASEYLLELRDRWLGHQSCQPQDLLNLYGRILEEYEVPAEGIPEEQVLLTLGLITETNCKLSVANQIYRCVFNHHWITRAIQSTEVTEEEALDSLISEVASTQFCTSMSEGHEKLSTEEITVFDPPLELEALNVSRMERNSVTPLLLSAEMGEELSADEVASFLSPQELEISNNLTASDGIEANSLALPDADQRIPTETTSSQSTTKTKSNRVGFWLVISTVMASVLIAVGTQLWRQQPAEVNPVVSSPLSEDIPASSDSPQIEHDSSSIAKNTERSSGSDSKSTEIVDQPSSSVENRKLQVPANNSSTQSDNPFVISRSDPTVKVPVFTTGSTRKQVLDKLGSPTWDRRGYHPGSRALFYEGIVPNRVDLGYLVSKATGELLQTEIAFAQSVSLETVQNTLRQLVQGKLPASVRERLEQVYQHQINQHTFTVENLKGDIHRDDEGWLYIGIWNADFH